MNLDRHDQHQVHMCLKYCFLYSMPAELFALGKMCVLRGYLIAYSDDFNCFIFFILGKERNCKFVKVDCKSLRIPLAYIQTNFVECKPFFSYIRNERKLYVEFVFLNKSFKHV